MRGDLVNLCTLDIIIVFAHVFSNAPAVHLFLDTAALSSVLISICLFERLLNIAVWAGRTQRGRQRPTLRSI
jgi:hypothetical protein